jgi:flagellum-specific peptidoglycan hydrolase FlgJ
VKLSFKRWQFLFISGVILLAVLAFSASYEARQAEIQELKAEKDRQLQQLREMREQLNEAAERLEELETMLLNLQRTELIMSGAPGALSPSRGGRVGTVNMPVTTPSGFSAARFEQAFASTLLEGIGEALVQAEMETGINALVLAAIIVHESDWGRSRLAREKNNLAGLGAYDGQEYSAGIRFDSRAPSIMFLAELLAVHYAPGGKFYGGSHDLRGIGVRYASDPRWTEKTAGCMKSIADAVFT